MAGTAERIIDVPIESLPLIDEHSTTVDAEPERVWRAVIERVAASRRDRSARLVARALGCRPAEASGEPGVIGSTIPGFVVARAVPPAVLALEGEHRYARYALIARLEPSLGGELPTVLVAESRAEFPGAAGRAYRALVIGSRGHVLAVRAMLRGVRRSAER
jgi:hypothetical protein